MKPSDYVKRQVYATFIEEPILLDGYHRYAADNAMWSSDYPHHGRHLATLAGVHPIDLQRAV